MYFWFVNVDNAVEFYKSRNMAGGGRGREVFQMFNELANQGSYLKRFIQDMGTPEQDLFQNEHIFHGYHL